MANARWLGIDLGTTNTLAAYLNESRVPQLIPDAANGETSTPSILHVRGNHCVVGHSLERLLRASPALPVCRNWKLAMGAGNALFEDDAGREWSAEDVAGVLLKKVRHDAAIHLGEEVFSAQITVPANFNQVQRLATIGAGLSAGFVDVELLDEPVAAATAYSTVQSQPAEALFVFDLGGGTFDATVLHSSTEGLHALATRGANDIGGKFVDEAVFDVFRNVFHEVSGGQTPSSGLSQRLYDLAEQTKCGLSPVDQPFIEHVLLADGVPLRVGMTYRQLSPLVFPLVTRAAELSERCVVEAGLGWSQIDRILMVGGSSALPAARQKLAAISGLSQDRIVSYEPARAVAYGAAIVAGGAARPTQAICSHDLGIRTYDPVSKRAKVEVLIPRNSPIPAKVKRQFFGRNANETQIRIQVVQSIDGGEHQGVTEFMFGPLERPDVDGVQVQFEYTAAGTLQVTADGQNQSMSSVTTLGAGPEAVLQQRKQIPHNDMLMH